MILLYGPFNIATIQKTAGMEPLDSRRNAKHLTHGEKVKRMPDHPLYTDQEYAEQNKPQSCLEIATEETF